MIQKFLTCATAAIASLALVSLFACARTPIPTSDQLPATATPSRLSTIALPSLTPTAEETATVTPEPTGILAPVLSVETPTATATVVQTPVAFERNPQALLVTADMWGGGASANLDMHVPTFQLYADGYVVMAGERASLSTGLDAQVRVGHLGNSEVQTLLAYLRDRGFYSLESYYEPHPPPSGLPTATISVYLERAKTVQVYGPGFSGTPQVFFDAFLHIIRTVPRDAQVFKPADAYIQSSTAGSPDYLRSNGVLPEWGNDVGIRLADALYGATVSGSTFSNAAALIAEYAENPLFREGNRAYRVRLVPNLPRAVHMTDWIGAIVRAPREFEGRTYDLLGYYRGANLLGEAAGRPATDEDWVIRDASGAIYVTGAVPPGLRPQSRSDVWRLVRLRAQVVYVRNGTSHLNALQAQVVP